MAQQKHNNKQSNQQPNEMEAAKDTVKYTEKDKLLVAIRIRGLVRVPDHIKNTLQMLNLHKKNYCSIYKDTPSIRGMLQKVKDYITFGEIDYTLYTQLVEKRAEKDVKRGGMKKFFRLHPPLKGYGRKGVKVPYANSGALGDRKNAINDLLVRMI